MPIYIIDRMEKLIGQTTTVVLLILLALFAVATEIWEWVIWFKLRPEHRARGGVEITSLLAGTLSIMIFAFFLTAVSSSLLGEYDWSVNLWIFGGAGVCWLALAASAFCRGRVRIAGIVSGMLMASFWWGLWSVVQWAREFTPFG